MPDVGVGFVEILPKTDKFLGTLKAKMASLKGAMSAEGASMSSALSTAFIAVGAVAVGAIALAVNATVKWGMAVVSVQRVTGLAAGAASTLAATASEYGVEVAKVNTSIGIFSKNVVANSTAFAAYGLNLRDATGAMLPLDQQLVVVAQKFEELGGAGERGTAFLKTAFGRGGVSLVPVMQAYANGLGDVTAQAKALGLYMNQAQVDQAFAVSLGWARAEESVKGLGVAIGTAFLPVALKMEEWFQSAAQWLTAHSGFITAALAFGALTGAVGLLMKAAAGISNIWGPIIEKLVESGAAVYGYAAAWISLAATEGVAAAASYALELALNSALPEILLIVAALFALKQSFSDPLGSKALPAQIITIGNLTGTVQQFSDASVLAASRGIEFGTALGIVKQQAAQAVLTLAQLNDLKAFDPTALLGSVPAASQLIVATSGLAQKALEGLATSSGASTDALQTAFVALQTNAKATVGDVQTFVASVKDAFKGYVDTIQQNINFTSGALSKFADKSTVSLGALKTALHNSIADTKAFGSALAAIAKSGPHGQDVASYIAQLGPAYAGMAEAMVSKSGQAKRGVVDLFSKSLGAGQNFAQQIADAINPVFENFLAKLKGMIQLILHMPALKIDVSQALSAIDSVIAAAQQIGQNLPGGGGGTSTGSGGGSSGGGGGGGGGGNPNKPPLAIRSPTRTTNGTRSSIAGQVRVVDWRNGLLTLDAELAHEYATSGW